MRFPCCGSMGSSSSSTTAWLLLLGLTCYCLTYSDAFFTPSVFHTSPSPTIKTTAKSSSSSSTVLYISSWGIKGASRWGGSSSSSSPAALAEAAALERKKMNPEEKIQAYLDPPAPVEARDNIDGTVLVSGLVNNQERTDQFVFDLLHHEDSAFEYKKIIAFCDDVKFAKKRLLSRSARYTGLLDQLEFVQANAPGVLPTLEQLNNVKTWVAVLSKDDADVGGKALLTEHIPMLAQLAQQTSTMHHVAILISNAIELDPSYCQTAVQALENAAKASNDGQQLKYTLIAVGTLSEQGEGKVPYAYQELTSINATLPPNTVFSREESLRLITECLQLESGVNRTLVFREVYHANATESKLIKGLREAGYARPQEIDHMIRYGPQAYLNAIEEWKTTNPDAAKGYSTTDAWWEDPKYARKNSKTYEEEKKEEEAKVKDAKTQEIEKIAKEWAKREFFRERMSGTLSEESITEADYIQSVWDRALKEGDIKYRQSRGELTDKDAAMEMEDFQSKQERKKQTMLKKAKEELAELLQEENLGGIDDDNNLQSKLVKDDDDDDDD